MRIKIIDIHRLKDREAKVTFDTDYGRAEAFWSGDAFPEINGSYDIEIDVDEILTWGQNIKNCKESGYAVGIKDGKVLIQGRVEEIETDSSVALRIGNSIILLETDGRGTKKDSFVIISTAKLRLFDANT